MSKQSVNKSIEEMIKKLMANFPMTLSKEVAEIVKRNMYELAAFITEKESETLTADIKE